MSSNLSDNPFAALFPSLADAEQFISQNPKAEKAEEIDEADKDFSYFSEQVFRFTTDPEFELNHQPRRPSAAVYLNPGDGIYSRIMLDNLDELLMLRLMHDLDSALFDVRSSSGADPADKQAAAERSRITYLSDCFWRVNEYKSQLTSQLCVERLEQTIVRHGCLLLQQLAFSLYDEEKPRNELASLLGQSLVGPGDARTTEFFTRVTNEVWLERDVCPLLDVVLPVLEPLLKRFKDDLLLGDPEVWPLLDLISLFSEHLHLTEALLDFCTPSNKQNGRAYQQTVLGSVLALGVLPRTEQAQPDFFQTPSRQRQQEHDATKQQLHSFTDQIQERLHQIFKKMLQHSNDIKQKLLRWIGNFISANRGRGQMWAQESPAMMLSGYAGLGTMLNLSSLLLNLCEPVTKKQVLSFQLGYLQASAQLNDKLTGLSGESGLIAASDSWTAPEVTRYTVATELFYMCHASLKISFHMAQERLLRIHRELNRIQGAFNDAQQQGSDIVERLRAVMDNGMSQFLSYQTALSNPSLLIQLRQFYVCTSDWLCRLAIQTPYTDPLPSIDRAVPLQYPLPTHDQPALSAVPEFFVNNIMDYVLFLKRYKEEQFEMCESRELWSLLDLVLVFMSSPSRLSNPHLRAQMAEVVEALLPPTSQSTLTSGVTRERLWEEHPGLAEVSASILHVFSSIESTGQSVEFELKFSYRRPMYAVLRRLWTWPRHRAAIVRLCNEAVENIEATDPPLFLRFINLLINDAIFLLDEGLQYMTQIKQQQEERDEWSQLPADQRTERENGFRQLGMLARSHNILGLDTIRALEMIANACDNLLTHPMMAERVAAMLNFFLEHLVGPKRRDLAVKNFESDYEFKPKEVVRCISQLYLDLSHSEQFCRAIAADGRSYNPELFPRAQAVLMRIGEADICERLGALSKRVEELSGDQQTEDELVDIAPEEFLDPIMGILMKDPVILPASRNTVDRQTIARHLLSDQTDPFNRQPLSMSELIPDDELRERVHTWINEQRDKKPTLSSS